MQLEEIVEELKRIIKELQEARSDEVISWDWEKIVNAQGRIERAVDELKGTSYMLRRARDAEGT